ncbi:MAG: transcriptional regulator [Turicibacter sp.]|nr:transcriptional regulator [Turicibacter sp.]
MNSLFLTVGEKIRYARRLFNLKQDAFRHFGITQHYLSMIETNKRQAPNHTLEDIYEAFMNLTNGGIVALYTLEEFCLSVEGQVNHWLDEQLQLEVSPQRYNDLMSVAEEYLLSQYIVDIDRKMGDYYFQAQDYSKMAYHYRRSIANSIKFNINPAKLYIKFGSCLRKLGKYDEATLNLCLACSSAQALSEDSLLFYDAKIYLALTYQRMGEYRLSLEVIDELLEISEKLKEGRYLGALIVKELCLRRMEGPEESRKYLSKLLGSEILAQFPDLSHYIYNLLGWNYLESKQYEKALEMLKIALPLRPEGVDRAITSLLIGHIHCEIGHYDEAQAWYIKVKGLILNSESLRAKKLWIEEQLDLYCRLKQFDKIRELFTELSVLVDDEKLSDFTLYELKATLYKRLKGQIQIKETEYHFLFESF